MKAPMTTKTAARPTRSRRAKSAFLLAPLALLAQLTTACFTLNVNVALPEAAVQRATDDYVRELYKAKEKGKASEATPAPSPSVSLLHVSFVAEAFANEELKMKLDSSKSQRIFARLRSRVGDIIAAKKSGVLGENNQGRLVLRGAEKLKPADKGRLQSLVSDENSDRADLYEEAVKSNHLEKSKITEVEQSFTRSFQTASPSGTWIQGMDGQWIQKP